MNISALRTALRTNFGARNYRITASGEVHVRGNMPNSIVHGWYVYGSVREAYSNLIG